MRSPEWGAVTSTAVTRAPETDLPLDRHPILLIEDEPVIARIIRDALQQEGFRVVVAPDGERGLERFRAETPSLVLLDLTLPRLSGYEVCRIVRSESTIPVVIVTGKASEADKVAGLEMGADDYVTKPFSVRELVSRVRAQRRRARMTLEARSVELLRAGPVQLDANRHEVHVRGAYVEFTPKEFDLLETLLLGSGRLRTRGYLITEVWGADYLGDTKTLDVHVKRLRQKIERDPHNPEHLVTVRGLGYRFLDAPLHPDR
jgi:two-component system, OmpR family, response regulator RegX3